MPAPEELTGVQSVPVGQGAPAEGLDLLTEVMDELNDVLATGSKVVRWARRVPLP